MQSLCLCKVLLALVQQKLRHYPFKICFYCTKLSYENFNVQFLEHQFQPIRQASLRVLDCMISVILMRILSRYMTHHLSNGCISFLLPSLYWQFSYSVELSRMIGLILVLQETPKTLTLNCQYASSIDVSSNWTKHHISHNVNENLQPSSRRL